MESLDSLLRMHRGHEPLAVWSPGFSRPELIAPPEGGTPNQRWFMEGPLPFFRMHWDHEPRDRSADLQVGAIGARGTTPSWSSALRFMESRLSLLRMHREHEPRESERRPQARCDRSVTWPAPDRRSALRLRRCRAEGVFICGFAVLPGVFPA